MPRPPKKLRRNPPLSYIQWSFLRSVVAHADRQPKIPRDPAIQVGEGDGEVRHALPPKPKPYLGMQVDVYDGPIQKVRKLLLDRGLTVEEKVQYDGLYCAATELGRAVLKEFVLSTLKPSDIKVNRTYRAKKPTEYLFAGKNDRTVVWTDGISVQYDGPSVKWGRHYPRVPMDEFLYWAEKDVTAELKATST